MPNQSRRELLRTGALLGAGIAAGSIPQKSSAKTCAGSVCESKWDDEYDYGHSILFMEEYYRGTMNILGCLSGEIDHIGELSSRAASVIKNGGTVWQSMNIGHMPSKEQNENRRGNPQVIKDYTAVGTKKNQGEMGEQALEGLKKGDMIFTCYCNRSLQEARDRGVYVSVVCPEFPS